MKRITFFIISIILCIGLMAEPGLFKMPTFSLALGQNVKVYIKQGGAEMVIASGGSLNIASGGAFKLAGTDMTIQLGYLSGITPGTAALNKCLVLGASKEIATITTATITNLDIGASGSVGTLDIFPATATNGKLTFTVQNQGAARTQTIDIDAMGQASVFNIGDPGAAACYFAASTAQLTLTEMDRLDGIASNGTAYANKAVILGGSKEISVITTAGITNLNVGADGTKGVFTVYPTTATNGSFVIDVTDQGAARTITLNLNAMGQSTTLNAADPGAAASYLMQSTAAITLAEADVLDAVSPGTAASSKAVVLGSSGEINTITTAGITNLNCGADGTKGIFTLYPTTATNGSFVIDVTDQGAARTITLNLNAMGQSTTLNVADPGAAASYLLQSTAAITMAEADVLDAVSPGTAASSKAVVLGSSGEIATITTATITTGNIATINGTDLDLGLSAGGAGTLDIFPTGGTLGKLSITATDSAGDTTTAITNASQAGARTYTIPDAGASASFVLSAGASELGGTRTFVDDISIGKDADTASILIFPATTASGQWTITAANNAADHTLTFTNASHGQATTYTYQDAGGATADIVTLAAGVTTAGELKRADLTEEALQVYGVSPYNIRAADGAGMGIAETAGDHYMSISANVWLLLSEVANNETETSISYFQFVIPPEYVSAGDFKIRIKHQVTGAGTDNGSSVDFEAYEQDGNGAVGGDLVTTAATSTSKDSWATTDFVVTSSGFLAGDIINIKFTGIVIENASANLQGQYDGIAILLDIKG